MTEIQQLIKQMEELNMKLNTIGYNQNNDWVQHTTTRIGKELNQLKKDFEPYKIVILN